MDARVHILEQMALGASLRSICATEGMPGVSTVCKWAVEDKSFGEQYARAREARAELYFDRLDDVSEEAASAETAVAVAGLRLKADNIKWQLARMAPKKYGDKLSTEHSGPDGGPIPFQKIERTVVDVK